MEASSRERTVRADGTVEGGFMEADDDERTLLEENVENDDTGQMALLRITNRRIRIVAATEPDGPPSSARVTQNSSHVELPMEAEIDDIEVQAIRRSSALGIVKLRVGDGGPSLWVAGDAPRITSTILRAQADYIKHNQPDPTGV